MGPQNGVMGEDMGVEIPHTTVPEQDLTEEKNMAKFSQTKEFKRLSDYADGRIAFYQAFMPDGRNVNAVEKLSDAEVALQWKAANIVIGEFKALLMAYQNAEEAVKAANQLTKKA